MKKKNYVLIISIVTMLLASLTYYFINVSHEDSPKTVVPSHKYKRTDSSKDIFNGMMKDMYPNVIVQDKKINKCNVNDWCFYEEVNNNYNEEINISKEKKNKKEYIQNRKYSEWSETGIYFNVLKMKTVEEAEKYKETSDYYFKKYGKDTMGKQYYFTVVNEKFIIEGSYAVLIDRELQDDSPVGFKKNLPFKEYFEKIEFED